MISARGLSKQYGSRRVVDAVTMDVAAGECVGLTGAPGSGRRTLLRLLATFVRPTSGTLTFDGVDSVAHTLAVRRRIGFADPECVVGGGLRVGEYVRLVAGARGVSDPPGDDIRLRALLSPVGLDPGSRIDALGAQARAVLAVTVALLVEPDALLVDEPFADADAGTRAALVERLDRARRRGAAIVVRTNDEAALRAISARIVRLASGRLAPAADRTTE